MGDMPAPVDAVRPPRDERLMAVLLSRSGDAGPLLTCTLAASQKSCDKSKPYGARGAEGKGPLRHHCEPLATAGSTPQPPPKNRQADAGRRKGRPGRPTSSPPVCGPVLAMAGTGAGEKRCASAHSEPCPLPLLASLPPASKLPAICGGVGATRMLLASSSHPAPPDCLVMPEVAVPSDLPDESLTAAATTEGEEGEEGECKSDDGLPSHDAEDEEEGEAEAEADGTEAEDDSPELELARELAIENQIGALPIEPEFSADGKAVIIRLIQPVYPSVAVNGKSVMYPATVWFSEKQVPPEKQLPRPNAEGLIKLRKGNVAKALFFCIGAGAVPFRVVLNTFRLSGFRQVEDGKWNVMWAKRVTPEEYQALNPFQRINHFPGTWGIGRKDNLARNLMRMRRRHGMEQYGFFVPSYIMPGDYRQLAQEFARHPQTFIVKPVASACARGIRLISRLPRPGRFKGHLVQKYIRNPLLLNGYKFDIRLYVVVTSFDPLRAYLFNEGLIRLASEPYQGGSSRLKNRCMHLTNYSINHTNATYVQPDGSAGESASKWCLADLIRWWGKRQGELKKSWDEVHTQIVDVIVKTLLSIEAQVTQQCARLCRHRNTCFELFGFDVLLDANCKPWVIEVNIMPSLCPSSVLDHGIKSQLIANLLTLIGVTPYDRQKWREVEDHRKRSRLAGQPDGREERTGEKLLLEQLLSDRPLAAYAHLLSNADKDLLLYSDSEYARRGNFSRIFPTASSWAQYGQFFAEPRPATLLLCRWELQKTMAPRQVPQASNAPPSDSLPLRHAISSSTNVKSADTAANSKGLPKGRASASTALRPSPP